ncbi:MAG: low molecular weight phosphatase family protein [Euryarchaeota archaeon]|nr:low molecular weight phosphatase family protein [Euryarchaeota archaeon]|tara:strand:+ start:8767 stop:9084 length:318 start_codon:yes stop_codon:yes gene_type:complete
MAEALAKDLGHYSESAGTHPGERVAENAISVIEELGISMEGQFPKSIGDIDESRFDLIISMGCGVECPNLPIDEDWGLDDPVGGSIEAYRKTRDIIRSRLSDLSN